LVQPYCVRWGTQLSLKRDTARQFLTDIYCGQTAGWIKIPLGTKVGLSQGHTVLDGEPAPPQKKGHSPKISAHVYCSQWSPILSICLFVYEISLEPLNGLRQIRTEDVFRPSSDNFEGQGQGQQGQKTAFSTSL